MHPVESALWFSTALFHAAVPSHPLHFCESAPNLLPPPHARRRRRRRRRALGPSLTEAATRPLSADYNKAYGDLSPIPGHHGHAEYKGQKFHWLHHQWFECNYGSDLVPFDHLFGTYRAD